MDKLQQAKAALTRIPEAAFLTSTEEEATDLAFQAVGDLKLEGIVLRCAQRASLVETSPIPCLIVQGETLIRSQEVPVKENAILTMLDLASGSLQCAPLFVPPAHKTPPESPLAAGHRPQMLGGRSLGIHWVDLRRHQGLSMSGGLHIIRMICWDWASNCQILQADPRNTRWVGSPSHKSHRIENLARSGIPISDQVSAALQVADDCESPTFKGVLRIKPPPEWPPARIRAILAVVQHNVVAPVVIHLDIEAWELGPSVRAASFEIRLNALTPEPLPPGDYQAYLLSGDALAGPQLLRL